MRNVKEKGMKLVFLIAASISILAIALICFFLFVNGVPAIAEIGPVKFLLGTEWRPANGLYGIFPMIVGSLYVTAGALIIGVPIGVLCAMFLAFFCPRPLYKIFKPMVELLAGIPSVIYGFFGLVVLVPLIRDAGRHFGFGGKGYSILAASILLGMMILPTIITVSEASLRAVPESYYEGALALGATKERTCFFIMLPAAKSGVTSAIVLGVGRAVGETMAVVMVAGNQPRVPSSILEGVRTLTANIVLEMGYAADLHRDALIATGVVLFVFILLTNLLVSVIRRKEAE